VRIKKQFPLHADLVYFFMTSMLSKFNNGYPMSNYQTSMMLVVWYVVQIIVAVFSDTTAVAIIFLVAMIVLSRAGNN
jgi:hypothetical protein